MEEYPFIIHGKKIAKDALRNIVSPFNGETVARISVPDKADVESAIQSSAAGFEKSRILPSFKRADILRKAAAYIQNKSEYYSKILCLEAGKPIRHARSEVQRAVQTLILSSEEAQRMTGESISLDLTPVSGNNLGIVRHFPLGPVAGISPFNFPLNLVCHKAGPAIAAGNSIVIKPASSTPVSAILLAEAFIEAGAPAGMFNVIPCGAALAEPLIKDDRLKMITFTGSPEVGWAIKAKAGKKRVCLELGGNAAVIVEPDTDIDHAVNRCVLGAYAYAGQVCISVQRILVHHLIADQFIEKFTEKTRAQICGDPLDEKTDIGPMIDECSADQTLRRIEEAVKNGAKKLCGGERSGTLVQPAVLINAPHSSAVWNEEIFAPVAVIESYKHFEDAIRLVNDSVFGLQAGVFTKDIDKAFKAYNEIEAGGIIINDIPTYRVDHMPYGGVKNSGFGREGVRYAVEEMTEKKLMVIDSALPC